MQKRPPHTPGGRFLFSIALLLCVRTATALAAAPLPEFCASGVAEAAAVRAEIDAAFFRGSAAAPLIDAIKAHGAYRAQMFGNATFTLADGRPWTPYWVSFDCMDKH